MVGLAETAGKPVRRLSARARLRLMPDVAHVRCDGRGLRPSGSRCCRALFPIQDVVPESLPRGLIRAHDHDLCTGRPQIAGLLVGAWQNAATPAQRRHDDHALVACRKIGAGRGRPASSSTGGSSCRWHCDSRSGPDNSCAPVTAPAADDEVGRRKVEPFCDQAGYEPEFPGSARHSPAAKH
jgi:hypothetical protein